MQYNLARYELCQNNFLHIYVHIWHYICKKICNNYEKNSCFIRGNEDIPKNLLDNWEKLDEQRINLHKIYLKTISGIILFKFKCKYQLNYQQI